MVNNMWSSIPRPENARAVLRVQNVVWYSQKFRRARTQGVRRHRMCGIHAFHLAILSFTRNRPQESFKMGKNSTPGFKVERMKSTKCYGDFSSLFSHNQMLELLLSLAHGS
jgi:hypothetical protein